MSEGHKDFDGDTVCRLQADIESRITYFNEEYDLTVAENGSGPGNRQGSVPLYALLTT